MSVNTELSALLTKMGGTPLESDSNSDLIKKISNAYEGGGGSSGGCNCLIINVDENGILDKTWKEIHNAKIALIVGHGATADGELRVLVHGVAHHSAEYIVDGSEAGIYIALTENDYPSFDRNNGNTGGNTGGDAQPT